MMDPLRRVRWRAVFWLNGELVSFADARFRWGGLPGSGVLWVNVWVDGAASLTMVGWDAYWVRGRACGMMRDSGERIRWDWLEDGGGQVASDLGPAEGAVLLRGVTLPDDVWERVWRGGVWPR